MYKQNYRCTLAKSRQEAIKKGYSRYLGTQCKRGHGGVRYASCGACVSCTRENRYKHINRFQQTLDHTKTDDIDKRLQADLAEVWD